MSDIFKLKVCIGDANIELEGNGDLVHTIFVELRENGLGKLSAPSKTGPQQTPEKSEEKITLSDDQKNTNSSVQPTGTQLPQINTIVIKNLPKTEAEWVLVYALYASEEGTKTFTESDLRKLYQESGRWNDSRSKNFSTNLKKAVTSNWFALVNDSYYSLLESGKALAYEIIQRSSASKDSKKTKRAVSAAKTSYTIVELNLNDEQRQDLKQYLQPFSSTNNIEKAVLIAYKLAQYGITELNANTIFTALRIAGFPASYDLNASLKNGKNQKNYFVSGDTAGTYRLHHLGEDRAKELEKAGGNS